jgi:protein-disulfide isomerase
MRLHLVLLVLLATSLTATAQSEPEVLAVVNGEDVSRSEVFEAAGEDLGQLAETQPRPDTYGRNRLEILWTALDSIVEQRLIALEAASLNVSIEQLLYIEIDSNLYTPSDAEVEAFYEQNLDQIPLPRDEALPQVREYLLDQSRQSYRRPMIQRYKQKYEVTTYLDPLRTEVTTAGHPSRGPEDAPVTIVEFGDFQCPFCGNLHPAMERVRAIYPDTVRIVFRNFPLRSVHPRAQQAAEAAMCAGDQGRFWEYHDSLFEDQAMLAIGALNRRAIQMGLDTEAFDSCLDSGSKADAVQADVDEGRAAGVTGTPTLFINGRYMSGPQPREIQAIIEDELDRAGIER